jgi:LmbE family N-acetylglucosaminyl deacetylase
MSKVLFLGCHADDIELGCGGTIHKNKDRWLMKCVTLSASSYDPRGSLGQHPDIWQSQQKALDLLGVQEMSWFNHKTNFFYEERNDVWLTLNRLKLEFNPDIVFTQASDDHQDHKVLSEETARVFQSRTILEYHIARSQRVMAINHYETLSRYDVEAKIDALKEYTMYLNKNYFQPEFIVAQARNNGCYIGVEFAESFRIVQNINL